MSERDPEFRLDRPELLNCVLTSLRIAPDPDLRLLHRAVPESELLPEPEPEAEA